MKSAYVLLSGGQDSTTCLYWALQQFDEVAAIGFYYGQKHANELGYARQMAEKAGVSFRVVDLSDIIKVDPRSKVIPLRNTLFLTNGAAIAASRGWNNLVIGACKSDYRDFVDCRVSFIRSMESSISLGLDQEFRIHAPLLKLSKAQVWKLAAQLGIVDLIVNHTLTDYNGNQTQNEWGKGIRDNPASETRAAGYYEAKERGWLIGCQG